jgi:hypothetical protein
MKLYYDIIDEDTIMIYLRFESEDGCLGEGAHYLHKGEAFGSLTFEQLIANGGGSIEMPTK